MGPRFGQMLLEKRKACPIGLAGNARNPAVCAVVTAKKNKSANTNSGRHMMMDSQGAKTDTIGSCIRCLVSRAVFAPRFHDHSIPSQRMAAGSSDGRGEGMYLDEDLLS
jgi:hypothetical protein